MRIFFLISSFLCVLNTYAMAQSDTVVKFVTLEAALKNPEKVEVLDLSKQKLNYFPLDILKFKNLRELYLNKNKITEIPKEISVLQKLEVFEMSKNKLTAVPEELFDCLLLKKVVLNQNLIETIPRKIGQLQQLTYLDMWSNIIRTIPREMANCKALKEVDFRVIEMTKQEQQTIYELLPNVKVHMSAYCSCSR